MGKKVYVDLTHPFSAEIPRWPYFDKPEITNAHTMAKGGVLTSKITCTMHTGTHCDAPRHVMEYEFDGRRARYTHEMPIDAYTGEAVVLKLDVEPWTLITDKHLDEACKKCGIDPASLKGKVLCLNTGMHRLFDDSKAYYHYSIGTGIDAGKWFVKHGVKCVAMDSQALDHPLHTAMGNNGMTRMNLLGATGKPITEEYKELFGEEAYAEFDKFEYIRIHGQAAYDEKFGELEDLGVWGTWEPCHKEMLGHGIVGVENLGGDLDKIKPGKVFNFFCFPLRWYMGDGAMSRCVAFIDEDELARNSCGLHYYRLNGILIGSVEPIDGIEEEPAPEVPAHTMDLTKSDLINAHFADGSVGLETGGEMMTEEWTLFPGRYRVTLTGSGFDHSYIYARYGLINQETYKLDIDFTGIDPNEMTFEFTATEMLHYWRTAVHTLDDANVTVNSVTVEKVG